MKKILVLFLLSIMVFPLISAQSQPTQTGVTSEGMNFSKSLVVESSSAFPATIRPGDEIALTVTLNNPSYGYTTDTIVVELGLPTGFTTIDSIDSLSELRATNSETVVFRFKAASEMLPGTYVIPLNMTYNSNGVSVNDVLRATISMTSTPEIDVTNVVVNPTEAETGKEFEVRATVKNIGGYTAKQITATLTYSSDYETYLLPTSETSIKMGDLRVGSEKIVSFNFKIDSDATPGVIPFTLLAESEDGESDTETPSLKIVGHPDLVPSNVSFDKDIIRVGDLFSASLELENIG
ncbi:MAG: hypothetical protein GOV15_00875, partial [Candidatus Diapherotrites archaeon]|nr:hypothetical protein [Candidatus Diapherotrites archaeon]